VNMKVPWILKIGITLTVIILLLGINMAGTAIVIDHFRKQEVAKVELERKKAAKLERKKKKRKSEEQRNSAREVKEWKIMLKAKCIYKFRFYKGFHNKKIHLSRVVCRLPGLFRYSDTLGIVRFVYDDFKRCKCFGYIDGMLVTTEIIDE